MDPLISIVTPSFNQRAYLEDALQSVLQQGYPALEYFVVDGASTDGSQEIIQRYQDRLSWWVSEPDRGQADAINKGFARAGGEILGWLNSDDLLLPGTLHAVVQVFKDHPRAEMVYGDAVSADAEGRLLSALRFDRWTVKDFLQFRIICQPAVFFKRSLLEKVGELDARYQFFLDHQLWIRMARVTTPVYHPRMLAVSRYHDQAKNVTMAASCGEEIYRILDWAADQPDLEEIITQNKKRVWAGAYQLHARYLLDGKLPWEAFKVYLRAARQRPASLPAYWQRFLFAGLSTLGLGGIRSWYYRVKYSRRPAVPHIPEEQLRNWPGLSV